MNLSEGVKINVGVDIPTKAALNLALGLSIPIICFFAFFILSKKI